MSAKSTSETIMGRPKLYFTEEEALRSLRAHQREWYYKNIDDVRMYQYQYRFKKTKGREPTQEEIEKYLARRKKKLEVTVN
jgi:hypothetical protein